MADLSAATSLLYQWLLSPLIWVVLIFVFIAGTIGILMIRKKRKLIYQFAEIVMYKNGKCGVNIIKGGWFGKKKALRRLFDYGEERLETQDGEPILNFSTEDFQEVNGKRGVIIARDPVNPDILVPISQVNLKGMRMLAEIAPAEYRDAALDIINDADRETKDRMAQMIQWFMVGAVIVFALVAIIVITQMVKNGQSEASKLIVSAGETCLQNAREVCSTIATSVSSNTAP